MNFSKIIVTITVLFWVGCTSETAVNFDDPESLYEWEIHDKQRPPAPVVTAGTTDTQPPSDAIVLFDGTDTSAWIGTKKGTEDFPWKVENGYMEVVPKSGSIATREGFGSCQIHIEWATPEAVKGKGQGRGNSGVYIMGHYEVQILDSYDNRTYTDGQAGATYGQNPPLVNVCRPPGQWQSFDIIFRAPQFDGDTLLKPATVTVLQNGVLIQDHWVFTGPTANQKRQPYKPHPEKLPLSLQDHHNPTRFRNIWIRPLKETSP